MCINAQSRSDKRGIGWDEKNQPLTRHHMEQLQGGVAWVYNWGNAPKNPDLYSASTMHFAPMCWNSYYNANAIRSYLDSHPETRYILGFNEPNFSAQANMTPAAAAATWPAVEKIAADYGLTLVAPALNFTGEYVGGRMWSPYEWLDEFFRLYPTAKADCLSLHCYMNWYSANTWFATEYFYVDLYDPTNDAYGRYPNLVKFLNGYKEANGHFPRMMLTEFCSWENDGTITGVDFQIDQMTQKLQKLEQSDLVEGYAWFMANFDGGASAYPYMSIFNTNTATSTLSDLGKVYVNMSSFDTGKFYTPSETILAKDYVDATTDNQIVRLRPNTDSGSASPLQLEMTPSAWTEYQLSVPHDGQYRITLRLKAAADGKGNFYLDGKRNCSFQYPSTSGGWTEVSFLATLTQGEHNVMLYNASTTSFYLNQWHYELESGDIGDVAGDGDASVPYDVYDISGTHLGSVNSLAGLSLPHGIYILRRGSEALKIRL